MLNLRTGPLPAKKILLGGNASIDIRPATAFEVARAHAAVTRVVAGLLTAGDAAEQAAAALGDDFRGADFTKPEWVQAATEKLVLLELTVLCADAWSGVCVDDQPIAEPSRALLALLLRDAVIAERIAAALQRAVHAEISEGNGSAASPRGGAATADKNVSSVEKSASLAPSA